MHCQRSPLATYTCAALATMLLAATPSPRAAGDTLPATATAAPAPIRFLLSFDDGPAAATENNPTVRILEALAHNPYQNGIKAVFFTQTRAWHGGGTDVGRQLIRREYDDGHLVALHTATTFHSNHRFMSDADLDASLQRGVDDLTNVTGVAPTLVRPPFWAYDAATLESYHRHGMQMLLTDLNANDGKIYGINWSWHKRSNMLTHLASTKQRWASGAMPAVDGSTPVVVTFHDVNTYTARHIEEYMDILLDVAKELNLPLAAKPFYDDRAELERAAQASTVANADTHPQLPGLWNWLWQ